MCCVNRQSELFVLCDYVKLDRGSFGRKLTVIVKYKDNRKREGGRMSWRLILLILLFDIWECVCGCQVKSTHT